MVLRLLDRVETFLERLPAQTLLLASIGGVFLLQMALAFHGASGSGTPLLSFSALDVWAAGSVSPRSVWERKESFRLLASVFLHGSLLHFLFNASYLVSMGRLLEELLGPRRLIATFLSTGLAGALVSIAWQGWRGDPTAGSVGSSGALCGLMGSLLSHCRRSPSAASQHLVRQLTIWALALLAFGLVSGGRIDNAAHIGGFVAGYLLAPIWGTPLFDPLRRRWKRRVGTVATTLLIGTTLASLAVGGSGAVDRRNHFEDGEALENALATLLLPLEEGVREREIRQIQLRLTGSSHWSAERARLQALHERSAAADSVADLHRLVRKRLSELAPDLVREGSW